MIASPMKQCSAYSKPWQASQTHSLCGGKALTELALFGVALFRFATGTTVRPNTRSFESMFSATARASGTEGSEDMVIFFEI